ncbi:non-heme iron oxygenase ferredoxin subunit [candidate division KSB1 bacterium]|nr:non-heme iron oxygenase ferredoxin subunit [candidate division KSB1 bacterium]
MGTIVTLCRADELPEKTVRRFRAGDRDIVLVRDGDDFNALQDRCSHENFPLSDGYANKGVIVCPMHGASFDLQTGEALSLPAHEAIEVYPVHLREGLVQIELDEAK